MSLIPYHPREGREIVLRHRNAIVVRDPDSQRLEIRGLSECPTCHQPIRSSSPERQFENPSHHEGFVDPNYFRMLRAGSEHLLPGRAPSSPVRRLAPLPGQAQNGGEDAVDVDDTDAEFVSSSPAVPEGSRIRREAFSPNYFSTFFVEERTLGRGGKGVVLLVRHEIDGCHLGHFACKRVPVGDDHAWLEKVLIEVELLAKLSHPNLVSYRHVWLEDMKLNRFGPSVACAFILQQYCNGGDLLHYVAGAQPKEATKEELKAQIRRKSKGQAERPKDVFASQRHLPFEEIFSLFKDITSGLAYLHAANYIHRDLKPSNCLLHQEGRSMTCLISDFGEVQPENAVRKSTGSTGTISYCAPEVLRMDPTGRYANFTTKSDIFSLGMILYFMCFGRLPYQSANCVQEELEDVDLLRAEITDWKGFEDERRERPDLPWKLYQLLKKLLSTNPAERPSANEVLSVMRNESSLDGVARGPMSPPIGLPARRIQNLDSPMPPSTPVPDPSKPASTTSASQANFSNPPMSDDASPQSDQQSSFQKRPNHGSPRYRAPHISASRSQDGYARASPEHSDMGSSSQESPPIITITTPLLMPPPTTFLGDVWHRGKVAHHKAVLFLNRNAGPTVSVLRLCLFLVKMISLARSCWPYMVNWGVGATLVAVAGMDLGMPGGWGVALPSHPTQGSSPARNEMVPSSHWGWGWKVSVLLLGAHFVVLAVVSRWGILCTPRDPWAGWESRLT